MLKDKRIRIVMALVAAVLVVAVAIYTFDILVISGTTQAASTGQPVAPTLSLKRPTKTPVTPSARAETSRLMSNIIPARPINQPFDQTTRPYTSCTEDRKATATPTGQAVATQAATAVATAAATTAAPAGEGGLIVFAIAGKESEACYQVGEIFFDGNRFGLAVGVSTAISGEIGIDKQNVANSILGEIVVDVSQLTSDSPQRDGQIRRRWLESNTYKLARFVPNELVGLPARAYIEGETLNFTIKGDLFVREKARPTEFKISAAIKDGVLYGTAITDAKMSDWGFEAPSTGGLRANNEVRIILNFIAREKK